MIKIVIVGFKVKEDNSVFYRKVQVDTFDDPKVWRAMKTALMKSDFVSVRIVKATKELHEDVG